MLRLSFKDAEKRIHAGDVMINRDAVKVAGRNVAGIQAGKWYHLEMSGQFGVGSDKNLRVRVMDQDGKTALKHTIPFSELQFK